MGRHRDPDTLQFIDWLKKKGESLNFIAETEYEIREKEYFADLVWKIQEDQDPIFTFEIETTDSDRVFSNTSKYFGTPSDYVTKPWRHFMIIYKTKLSQGHKKSLHNVINQHNILLFEDVFNDDEEKERLENELDKLSYDLSNILKRYIRDQPLAESLPLIIKSLEEALKEWPIGQPKLYVEFGKPSDKGIEFSIKTETPKGKPLFIDRMIEASKTMKPFTIDFPELKDFIIEGKSVIPNGTKKAKVTIIPKPRIVPLTILVPNKNIFYEGLLIRLVKSEGPIKCFSTEDRNIPIIFEFCINDDKKNGTFNLTFDTNNSSITQTIKFEEFINSMNEEKKLLVVEPKTQKTIIKFIPK